MPADPEDEEDTALIRRCAGSDPDALRALMKRWEPALRPLLFRLLDQHATADVDDVLCDVFVRLWRTAGGFRGKCSARTWVCRIAVSAATDVLRQRRVQRCFFVPLSDQMPGGAGSEPEQALLDRERDARHRALARAALACLGAEERVAVVLHHIQDHSYGEVAAMTGVPVTTVRMRLFRARRRMQARLREWMEDDEIPHPANARPSPSPIPANVPKNG